ncbi:unnamed protein product, partial [Ectocarpus sp. 12 AP-2014]
PPWRWWRVTRRLPRALRLRRHAQPCGCCRQRLWPRRAAGAGAGAGTRDRRAAASLPTPEVAPMRSTLVLRGAMGATGAHAPYLLRPCHHRRAIGCMLHCPRHRRRRRPHPPSSWSSPRSRLPGRSSRW